MSSESAGCSYYSHEKEKPLLEDLHPTGTHKVKYHPDEDWDFHLETIQKPIELSLVLPHYRARNQPVEHRMAMFVGSETGPVKLKVCRHIPRSKFYLEIQGATSDVTIWLPSDFKGQIHYSGRASFSAGFINRIMQNVRLNEDPYNGVLLNEDDVVVHTRGNITFRMWDIQTCAPENTHREALKRIFGCARRSPETTIDWDFLLED